MNKARLLKLEYRDPGKKIKLEAHADVLVYDNVKNKNYLVAAHFGSYPEVIKAFCDAIYGGGAITVHFEGKSIRLNSYRKQYFEKFGSNGKYAEALIYLEETAKSNIKIIYNNSEVQEITEAEPLEAIKETEEIEIPRTTYILNEAGNMDLLFRKLDEITSVPLIPEFKYYFIREMISRDLLNRGLDETFIAQRLYRSLPDNEQAEVIAEKLSRDHDLYGIPGFYTENFQWHMSTAAGILIPMCSAEGYIQGLQVRNDIDSKYKYFWFSSKGKENGMAASSSWYHVSGPMNANSINLTEGGLKSDVAFYFSGETFTGIPGVSCTAQLSSWLRIHGITHIKEYWDMDKFNNDKVHKALAKMRFMLLDAGIGYEQMTWDDKYKGIDDFYRAMNRIFGWNSLKIA